MTIEPTQAPNEFKVKEWDATFLFSTPNKMSIDQAKALIDKEVAKQFEIFLAQRIKKKHHTIALIADQEKQQST